ncbi:alkaline phosphatase [Anaerobacillus alkalilacustris]|uniref:alkaline phosphatase n=1 Tax=Anaerobacillus alkalilacustris TaxID=393763 RepID=UPI001FE0A4BE|nr:alkaline phosphatase [Anaerobacillus alkalilacustris]
MANQLNADRTNVREVLSTYAKIDLTTAEEKRIKTATSNQVAFVINTIISERAYVGWSTTADSGVDVPLYAYGPSADLFNGLLDNTDLRKRMAEAIKIEFAQ